MGWEFYDVWWNQNVWSKKKHMMLQSWTKGKNHNQQQ
jgi:hypothetical protein